MKTISRILIIGLIVALPLTALYAQGHKGPGKMMDALELTDEQESQILELRLDHQKEMMTLRDERHGLRTEMKLLLTEDNPSSSKVSDLAGKVGDVAKKTALEKADHRMKIRNILTDEQKVKFDLMALHRGEHKRHHGPDPPAPPGPPGCRRGEPGESPKRMHAR